MARKKNDYEQGMINSLSEGTEMSGDMKAAGDFRVAGKFKGQLSCDGKVVITNKAYVEGDISCAYLDVQGEMVGNVEVDALLTIGGEAHFTGNISTGRIAVEEGAVLAIDKCVMKDAKTKKK